MNYHNFTYPQLKKECSRLKLGGSGNREVLTQRLLDYQSLINLAPIETRPETEDIASEQDPPRKPKTFSNWDENGKWIRRPKGFISWEEEARKAG